MRRQGDLILGESGRVKRAVVLPALLTVLLLALPLISCTQETTKTTATATMTPATTAMATTTTSTTGRPVNKISDGYRNYYEIFVRSFFDQNGDGLGDLAGVTAKLDYVADTIGADGIWLMPICPSPTYHKYDVTDYLAIDPEYGSLADFDRLIAEAHKRDIKVILDLVLNHTSNLHPWFDKAVQALWKGEDSPYIQYYNFTLDNPGQGFNKITDKYYYECRFVSGMPDLNLDSPAVRDEIRKITQFWLDRGVDGFRLDAATSYYTGVKDQNIVFLGWLNNMVILQKPDAYLVGEVWSESLTIAEYYASGIDSFFNFPYSQPTGNLVAALNERNGQVFAEALTNWNQLIHQKSPAAKDALFLSNHDQARSAGFLLRNLQKQKMAAALYLLAPGNPFIYYGEELGMTGSGVDPNKRLPMVWSESDRAGMTSPPPGSTQTITGLKGADDQAKDPDSLLRFYRQVLDIKARHPEIARGTMAFIQTEADGIAAFSLTYQGKVILVYHNLAESPARIDLSQAGLQGFNLTESLVTSGSEKPILDGQMLILPSMATAILK